MAINNNLYVFKTLPNTLVHIALQTPISRGVLPKTPIPWIVLGTTIPDIPWILQRIISATNLVDPYWSRLYVTAQASLFFCLLLSLAFAGFSKTPLKVFALLACNSLLHLLFDAMQIKWGNGVHLFAPFNWQQTSFNLFWPEHLFILPLSIAGAAVLLYFMPAIRKERLQLRFNWKLISAPLFIYLLLPFLFFPELHKSNPSYLATIQDIDRRSGQPIELDRSHFDRDNGNISLFTREKVDISGNLPEKSGTVSIRGFFLSPHTITAQSYHYHTTNRDIASFIGLAMTLTIWAYAFITNFKFNRTGTQP